MVEGQHAFDQAWASSLLTDFRTRSRPTDTAGGETEVWLSSVEPGTERSCGDADDRYSIFAGPDDSPHWYGIKFHFDNVLCTSSSESPAHDQQPPSGCDTWSSKNPS
jgi:hypothetical protein